MGKKYTKTIFLCTGKIREGKELSWAPPQRIDTDSFSSYFQLDLTRISCRLHLYTIYFLSPFLSYAPFLVFHIPSTSPLTNFISSTDIQRHTNTEYGNVTKQVRLRRSLQYIKVNSPHDNVHGETNDYYNRH